MKQLAISSHYHPMCLLCFYFYQLCFLAILIILTNYAPIFSHYAPIFSHYMLIAIALKATGRNPDWQVDGFKKEKELDSEHDGRQ